MSIYFIALAAIMLVGGLMTDLLSVESYMRLDEGQTKNYSEEPGKFELAPGASTTDGRLDLVVFHGVGRLATLAFARDLALGRHLQRSDVEICQVQRVEVLSPEQIPIQIDGDTMPIQLPTELTIGPQRLTLLAPDV